MPVRHLIESTAFEPTAEITRLEREWHHFTLRPEWLEGALDMIEHATGKRRRALPTRSFRDVLAAVASEVLTLPKASWSTGTPLLYALNPLDERLLARLFLEYAVDLAGRYRIPKEHLIELARRLQPGGHALWNTERLPMTVAPVEAGLTARPEAFHYRLLPDLVARKLAAAEPYEHGGASLSFRRAVTDDGAELVSWPPLAHRGNHYSAVLAVQLRTEAFWPTPRVHLRIGVRRWRPTGKNPLRVRGRQGVYLTTPSPWIEDGPISPMLSRASIRWDGKTEALTWAWGGPGEMLARLGALRSFPSPAELCANPDAWIDGVDGVAAALVHRSIGTHEIDTGVSPTETRSLMEWATGVLEPELRRTGPLRKLGRDFHEPKRLTGNAVDDAEEWRVLLSKATDCDEVDVQILYRDRETVDALVSAAAECLGGVVRDVADDPDGGRIVRYVDAVTVALRFTADRVTVVDAELATGERPWFHRESHERAVRERTELVRARMTAFAVPGDLTFVELPGREHFKDAWRDPKQAIRAGLASAGRVAQFIRPPSVGGLDHRARSAFRDGLRELGVRFVPEHSLRGIPKDPCQVGIWAIRRRDPHGEPVSTPVAVLIDPDRPVVLARLPKGDWAPYPEILKELALSPPKAKVSRCHEEARFTAFVQEVLYDLRLRETVLFVSAENSRGAWTYLTDGKLRADRIELGDGMVLPVSLSRRLRLIRWRTAGNRMETPQWWAPVPLEAHAGFSSGLWRRDDQSDRVYYGLAEKSPTAKKSTKTWKFTPGDGPFQPGWPLPRRDLTEITVVAIPPGEDPATWAAFANWQRHVPEYRAGLALPLVLKLARDLGVYAQADPGEED